MRTSFSVPTTRRASVMATVFCVVAHPLTTTTENITAAARWTSGLTEGLLFGSDNCSREVACKGHAPVTFCVAAAALPWAGSELLRKIEVLAASSVDLQHSEEGLLRDLHFAHPLHPFLPLFLLLEELSLAGDVTAIALGEDVLAQSLHGFAGNDAIADRRLQGHFKHLSRDVLLHLLDEQFPSGERFLLMHDQREGVEGLAVDEDVHLHQVAFAVSDELVI